MLMMTFINIVSSSVLFDGFSTFEVNSEGLISKHQLDKVLKMLKCVIGGELF